MKLVSKLIVSLTLLLLVNNINAQVNLINLLYNSVPGIGCHSNMSVCLATGSISESGAQIIVDWTDGDLDTLVVYSPANSENCYIFEHDYAQVGVYNALVEVTSGTLGGQVTISQTIEWVITSSTNCGFFNIISLLNPSSTFLSNVPYDIVDDFNVTTTIYPINSFSNQYYTELDVNSNYTVSINTNWLQNNGYTQTSPNFSINSFDATGKALNVPMNMTLQCNGNGNTPNLEVTSASAYQFIAPIENGNVSVQICNISCSNFANSTVKIAIPSGVTPSLTTIPNSSFSNDTVTILVPYLSGNTTISFPCTFSGSTPAGTVLNFYVSVSAIGEQDFNFNNLPFSTTVLNSYDPNDKNCNLPRYINPDLKENLQYTVRFQNDGNYPALNVVVRDTISSNLDLSTFRFINSSHPVSYTINPITREVTFKFSGINLAASSTSLEASQGYFTYTIDELPNLNLNSDIENTAYIYFDFNPPIVTNTTLNTNAYLGLVSKDSDNEFKFNIFPNPTNGIFTLDLSENTTVKIYSVIGSLIYEQEVQKDQIIDLTNYKKGIYTIQVNTPKYISSKKLIVE
ncbi:MAG: hypothetical protein RJA13_1071 [Bacteroidota bacterium]